MVVLNARVCLCVRVPRRAWLSYHFVVVTKLHLALPPQLLAELFLLRITHICVCIDVWLCIPQQGLENTGVLCLCTCIVSGVTTMFCCVFIALIVKTKQEMSCMSLMMKVT